MRILPYHKELDIGAFSRLLKTTTNIYKFYWLWSIVDEIMVGNQRIFIKQLACRLIVKSWYSLTRYKLSFGVQDQLSLLVEYIQQNLLCDHSILEESLLDQLLLIDDPIFLDKLNNLIRYVPYRLLAPFFDLRGIADHKKNRVIKELAGSDPICFYCFSDNDEFIIVNSKWLDYILFNSAIIYGWIKYHIIEFLQSRNPNVPAISSKLSQPSQSNLNKAISFWRLISQHNNLRDIYTNQPLAASFSIDHFIPWSFVHHDQIWNLIPTTRSINSSKSDGLPLLDKYLEGFCSIQYKAFKTSIQYQEVQKVVEDYFLLDKKITTNVDFDTFVSVLRSNIIPLHQIAVNQGFPLWKGDLCS